MKEEFLNPLGISAYKLSKDIDIPQARISGIVNGNRRITADSALRLSKYFGNSAKFWLGLQDDFDIEAENIKKKDSLNSIKLYSTNAAKVKIVRKGRCSCIISAIPDDEDRKDLKTGSAEVS